MNDTDCYYYFVEISLFVNFFIDIYFICIFIASWSV